MNQTIYKQLVVLINYLRFILLGTLVFLTFSGYSQTPDFTGIKVMLNPGHGGHDSDDRGMPNGFWESEGNLTKGLWLRDLLEARGCQVIMSRVENRTEDDLPLSQIAEMANANNVDVFLSIHSNAGNQSSNYPMTIFNGKSETPSIPEAKVWAQILWEHLITNQATYWTNTSPHYIGDLTLNPGFTYGYGVLYPLEVPGIISEGSFHDYKPEMDRLLSIEYRYQEAWNMLYALEDYFNLSGVEDKGQISGIIRDSLLVKPDYTLPNAADRYEVVNKVQVKILETEDFFQVDSVNTGFYYFDSLTSGNYNLVFSCNGYFNDTVPVIIEGHRFTYLNYWMEADKTMPPAIVSTNPANGSAINCFDPISITFNMNMDSASFSEAFSIVPTIEGLFIWDAKHLNVNFQPSVPYNTNTEYTVTIDATVQHQWGVSMGKIVEFSFTTGARNRYLVEWSFPDKNQNHVCPYLQFRLVFDAPLNNTSLINAVSIITDQGETIGTKSASISIVDGRGHYYFSPDQPLGFNKTYKLLLKGSIKDYQNIPLVDDYEIPFTTQEPISDLVVLNEWESVSEWSIDYTNSISIDQASFLYKWNKEFRSGNASMLLRYKFLSNSSTVLVLPKAPITITEGYSHVGMWIWGEMSQNKISLTFNDTLEDTLCIIDFAGWQYCTLPIPKGAIEITSIKLYRTTGGAELGDLYFDALSITEPTSLVEEGLNQSLHIFPNPLSGREVNVKGLPANKIMVWQILNSLGQVTDSGIASSDDSGYAKCLLNMDCKSSSILLLKLTSNASNHVCKIIIQ